MKMIKLVRKYSVIDTYINPSSIDVIYYERDSWNVMLRSRVIYDITEQCASDLLKDNKK